MCNLVPQEEFLAASRGQSLHLSEAPAPELTHKILHQCHMLSIPDWSQGMCPSLEITVAPPPHCHPGASHGWLLHWHNIGIFISGLFYIKYNTLTGGRFKCSRSSKIKLNYKAELHLNATKHLENVKMQWQHEQSSHKSLTKTLHPYWFSSTDWFQLQQSWSCAAQHFLGCCRMHLST